jgi:class 3 adenylate cyclase/tetratricopeptide (TPR) repeat protein
MQCPSCQAENREGRRFCAACGARLAVACDACGFSNEPGEKFCGGCATPLTPSERATPLSLASPESYTPGYLARKILTSKSALEGERKQVTVLFVDIVDSSGLAGRLDPESMHQLMDRVLRLMADTVHRYAGTVNQFLGDGLMALFGAPLALEDHAVRAVQAALAIRETVSGYNEQLKPERGVEIQLRQGLNSGLVVVGKIGDDLRMDYTAVGDTTHIASRMQALAEPGTIFITDATHRLVRGYVNTEAVGPVEIKGRVEPVSAFKVTGRRRRRSRLEVHAEGGLPGLIGRERELAVLQDCLARAKGGRGQVVGLVGEPGVGKSRLVHEFRQSIEGQAITWLETHCDDYGHVTPYLPIIDVLRMNFHIEDGDNPLQIEEKLRQGIRQIDPRPDSDLDRTLPFLRELLGSAVEDEAVKYLDPKEKRRKTFEAIRTLTVAGAQRRPLVVVLEDLHWIDKTSENYVAFLIESLAGVPALLLTTHRPGYVVRWTDKTYYTQIAVNLLTEGEVEALIAEILHAGHVPPDLVRVIQQKAEGNPLFVEEIAASLGESGHLRRNNGGFVWAKEVPVAFPGSIQDIIRARLDRLDDPVKRTAQTAAVIGRAFGVNLLTRVSEISQEVQRYLDTLKRVELVHESQFLPEVEYIFKHAVIQDVAYQSLLAPRRQELHEAIGRAIEDLYPERLEEQAPILAYHYARSPRVDKAIAWALLAGDQAARLYANTEATAYYEQALTMARALPASADVHRAQADATLKLAALGATREEMERDRANLEQARGLAETLRDATRLSRVLYWLGRLHYVQGDYPTAIAYAKQSLDIADRLGDDALAALPVNLLGRVYWWTDFGAASQLLERSIEQMRRLGNKTEEATAAGYAGTVLGFMGEFDRALPHADHGIWLAREIQNPFAEAAAAFYRGMILDQRGDWRRAIADYDVTRGIAERTGDLFRLYLVTFCQGRAYTMAGDPSRGRVMLEDALHLAGRIGTRFFVAGVKAALATCLTSLGDLTPVPSLCEEAIGISHETGDRFFRALAHRALGEALLRMDPADAPKAESAMLEAIRLQEEIGARPELARTYIAYARLLQGRGEAETARGYLTQGARMFEEMGMTWDLKSTGRALEQV